MTDLPPVDKFTDPTLTNGAAKGYLDDHVAFSRERMGAAPETTLALTSGTITPTIGMHAVDTESLISTDDLTNILPTNLADGSFLLIRAASSGRFVIAKHNAGGTGQLNLATSADFTLDLPKKWLMLRRNGAVWDEVFRSYANDSAGARDHLGLGTAAVRNAGSGANEVLLLDSAGKIPPVDGSQITNAAFVPTGAMLPYLGWTAPAGFVLACGRSIGNAASGANERAHADCQNLFVLLWHNIADGQCPVSGGRGASGAADFAANKRLTLPDMRGRAPIGNDAIGGTAAGRMTAGGGGVPGTVQGAWGGSETHHLLYYQCGFADHGHTGGDYGHGHPDYTHNHPLHDGGHNHRYTGVPSVSDGICDLGPYHFGNAAALSADLYTQGWGTGIYIDATGANIGTGYSPIYVNGSGNANAAQPHPNTQPSLVTTMIIKL